MRFSRSILISIPFIFLASVAARPYDKVADCPTDSAISAPSYLTYHTITVPTKFACPLKDRAGYPVDVEVDSQGSLFCPYPIQLGQNPLTYYCKFNATTGRLTQDHDDGFCTGLNGRKVPDLDNPIPIQGCADYCDADPGMCYGFNIFLDDYSNQGTTVAGETDQYTCSLFNATVSATEATNRGGQSNPSYGGRKTTIEHSLCFNLAAI